MFVSNFIILCQAVPEKSLTEKKFTHTRAHTHTSSQKRQKLYTPYILRICRGYKNWRNNSQIKIDEFTVRNTNLKLVPLSLKNISNLQTP